MNKTAALFLALIIAGGCAADPGVRQSRQVLAAQRHNARGFELVQREAYGAARAEFAMAYGLYASVDDVDGMGAALLNQVRSDRLAGDASSARQGILHAAEILTGASGLMQEFDFEEAMLDLAGGDLARCREKSAAFLAGAPDERKAAGRNLLALVALREGNKMEARRQAAAVLAAGDGQESSELANSHRILGDLDLEEVNHPQAALHFGSALDIDRKLGKSRKIVIDLRGLARAAEMDGDKKKMAAYLKRARETALASGDMSTVRSIEVLLGKSP